jgi:hypothetical protein
MRARLTRWILCFGLSGILLSGCMSLGEALGRAADGSAFAEKTIERYSLGNDARLNRVRFKDNSEALTLAFSKYPNLVFYLSAPTPNDGYLEILSYTFISSTTKDWNSFTMNCSGSGTFTEGNGQHAFKPPDTSGFAFSIKLDYLEETDIAEGSIRGDSKRINGGEAVILLRNRRERIAALSEWMKENAPAAAFRNEKEFDAYWKPILMPELTAKKKRPTAYDEKNAEWVWAEDVKWNSAYTSLCFPEHIGKLRDSGAILRDWEEALPWIYLLYQWDDIIKMLCSELYFSQKDK